MKNLRFLSKARLHLCLVLSLCWASCVAKHGVGAPLNVKSNKTSPADTVWYMEIKLMPGYVIYNLPFNALDIAQPYGIQNDPDQGNTIVLVLRYRFTDELLLQEVKNSLLATGRVADIRITISSY
jgi:hypothetical protein